MSGGIITVQDEQKGDVRHILAGSLTHDGFLMLDRIQDNSGGRKFLERLTLNPQETKEFYKQLKELMED